MKLRAIAAVFSVHLASSLGSLLVGVGHTMARVETGAAPTLGERAIDLAMQVLLFPLVHLARQAPQGWFPGAWGYVPFLLNSALWAMLAVHAWRAAKPP